MKMCASSHCQGNLQFEERLIIVTNRWHPVENGPDFVFEIMKNFHGYDPI